MTVRVGAGFFETEAGKQAAAIVSTTSRALIEGNYLRIPTNNIPRDMTTSWAKALDEFLVQDRKSLRPWRLGIFPQTYVQDFSDGAFLIFAELPMEVDGTLVDSAIRMTFIFENGGQSSFEGLSY